MSESELIQKLKCGGNLTKAITDAITILDAYFANKENAIVNGSIVNLGKKTYIDGYDDSSNSYKYIVFVLVIYAGSFMALMVKYFWKSHEGKNYENLYDEFVKRDSFKEKLANNEVNTYDLKRQKNNRNSPHTQVINQNIVEIFLLPRSIILHYVPVPKYFQTYVTLGKWKISKFLFQIF